MFRGGEPRIRFGGARESARGTKRKAPAGEGRRARGSRPSRGRGGLDRKADGGGSAWASCQPTRFTETCLGNAGTIVATDLNQAMLDRAAEIGTKRPVHWHHADAMSLPFGDETFDAVVCQFGVMFFPDKAKAHAEARRVLRPGGLYVFSVWDRIEDNDFANAVTVALESIFPDDPPRFMARTPHGYCDRDRIKQDVAAAGFSEPIDVATVTARSSAASSRIPAMAICQGTPLRNEIEARDPARLDEATEVATKAIAQRFGDGAVDGKIQALVVTVRK